MHPFLLLAGNLCIFVSTRLKMTKAEIIQFWKYSSDKDFQTMLHLYDSGDYMWSLFMGHLVVEKVLKAYYISKKDENYPYSHNLLRIAESAGMDLNEEQQTDFSTITSFNLNANMMITNSHSQRSVQPSLLLSGLKK